VQVQDKTVQAGVYALICLWRGIAYIGGSARLKKRFEEHLALLRRNCHKCGELQQDWNWFGPDGFVYFPLERVPDTTKLCERERAWTKKCLIEGKVYNKRNAVTEKHQKEFSRCNPKWPKEQVGASAKEYCFVSPTGEVLKVRGLRVICSAL
jgi:group I intron endonuclease